MFARKILLCLIPLAMYAAIAYGDTYQCRHSNGRIELSNLPCPVGSKTEKVIGGAGKQTGMWIAPEGYIGRTDPRWQDRETISRPFDREVQPGIKEMQQRLLQAEIDIEIAKEIQEEQEEAAIEAAELARQEAEEADERAKVAIEKAEQAADEINAEMIRSAIRTKNNFYLGGILLATGSFVAYFIMKANKGKPMNDNQKYGIVTMVISFLLVLLSLMISEGWWYRFDYLENLMNVLTVDMLFFAVKTKYVVLALLSTAAYGLTTYLDITPAFKLWGKSAIK